MLTPARRHRVVVFIGATTMLLAALSLVSPALPAAHAVQTLTTAVEGKGGVTSAPSGIDCPATCQAAFKDFEKVTLTATPQSGWTLEAWSGDCSGKGGCEVVMDGKRDVKATFVESASPPLPPPPPPLPAPAPLGPSQKLAFDDVLPGPLSKEAIAGVTFPIGARVFVPRTTAPFSYPRALGLDACATPGKGSALPMKFDPPVKSLSLRAGFDDRPAPKEGTYGRLVGYDAAGEPAADSGDVPLALPGKAGAIVAPLAIESAQVLIASAAVYVGEGTVSHDSGARCAIVDDLEFQVGIALQAPRVTITAPADDRAVFAAPGDAAISGEVRSAHGIEAFCVTVGDVPTMPAGCNLIVRVLDPRDLHTIIDEPLRDGVHFSNLPVGGLRQGRNRVTAWVRDGRNQVGRHTVQVEVTGEPLTYDVLVRGIEVTQAVQPFALPRLDLGAPANAQIGLPYQTGVYNGVMLAAGGRTFVRVFPQFLYSGRSTLRGLTARLWGYRDGPGSPTLLAGGPLAAIGGPIALAPGTDFSTATVDRMRADPSGGFTFVLPTSWTTGTIRLAAEIVPPPGTARLSEATRFPAPNNNAAGVTGVPFQRMSSYRLSVVALDSTFTPQGRAPGLTGTSACGGYAADANASMRRWFDGLEAILPLGMGQLRIGPYVGCVDVTPIHRCNAADRRSGACTRVLNDMGELTKPNGDLIAATTRFAEANDTPGQPFGLNGAEPGAGFQLGPYAISSTDGRPLTSVAHEVGHLLRLGHAACDAGELWPPDGVGLLQGVGLDDRPGSGGASAPFRVVAPNRMVSGATCTPAEGASCGGSSTPQFVDFMSYCDLGENGSWISTRNWTVLVNTLRAGALTPPDGVGAPRRSVTRAGSPTLRVTAFVAGQGTRIVDVAPGRHAPTRSDDASRFRVVVRDGAGRILSSTGVTAEPASEPGGPSLVSADVPAGAGAAHVDLLRDASVLATRARSAHAPAVTVLAPRAKVVGGGRAVTVRWRATDADGDPLAATVEYSADGGRRYRAIGVGHGSEMRLPSQLFARSRRGRVRVVVNDGFSEASAASPLFAAVGAAPAVRISYPTPRLRVANDASITLAGQATDDAGASLAGGRLRWFAGAEPLGTGAALSVHGLPAGTRSVRLVATDRFGRRAGASVRMRVFASAPQFTVLDAPARVSRRARTVRMRVASAIRATLVAGSRRFTVDRNVRTISVPVRRAGRVAVLALRLSAAGKSTVRTLRIPRA